jgi:hypothetical protein
MTNEQVAAEIGRLVDEKSKAYGDSVGTGVEALKLLWPDGIPVSAYGDAQFILRVWDKLKRIATANDPFGESPWQDVAGYAIRAVALQKARADNELPRNPVPAAVRGRLPND